MSTDVDAIAAVLSERMSKGTSGRYIAAFTETPETLAAAIAAALTPAREDEAAVALRTERPMTDPTPAPSAAPDDYSDLRAAAEGATPGPWSVSEDNPDDLVVGGEVVGLTAWGNVEADAAFIAAANPATILRLLDELAAARAGAGEADAAAVPAELADAIKDTLWRMTVAGQTEDGDVAHYIVTKGTVHRLVAATQNAGVDAALRNAWVPEPPEAVKRWMFGAEAAAKVIAAMSWPWERMEDRDGWAPKMLTDPDLFAKESASARARLESAIEAVRAALSGDPA